MVTTNGTGSASRDIRDEKQRERSNKPVVHHGTQRPENDNQRVEDKEKRGQRVQVRDGRERSCVDRITETSPSRALMCVSMCVAMRVTMNTEKAQFETRYACQDKTEGGTDQHRRMRGIGSTRWRYVKCAFLRQQHDTHTTQGTWLKGVVAAENLSGHQQEQQHGNDNHVDGVQREARSKPEENGFQFTRRGKETGREEIYNTFLALPRHSVGKSNRATTRQDKQAR
jgi:hypothetical protein